MLDGVIGTTTLAANNWQSREITAGEPLNDHPATRKYILSTSCLTTMPNRGDLLPMGKCLERLADPHQEYRKLYERVVTAQLVGH